MIWRLIHSQPGDSTWNMALDEAILRSVINNGALPTVRVYSWIRPSISLGRFQQPRRVLNQDICIQRGVSVVKRLTGGKAVLHGHDITISISAPSRIMGEARGVLGSHLAITKGYVKGLAKMGFATNASHTADRHELVGHHANCFAASAAGDVTAEDGLKVIGGAQYRRADCFMEQTSIPVMACPDMLRGVLTDGIELLPSPFIGWDRESIVQSLLAGLAEQLDVQWVDSEPTASELDLTNELLPDYVVELSACES